MTSSIGLGRYGASSGRDNKAYLVAARGRGYRATAPHGFFTFCPGEKLWGGPVGLRGLGCSYRVCVLTRLRFRHHQPIQESYKGADYPGTGI